MIDENPTSRLEERKKALLPFVKKNIIKKWLHKPNKGFDNRRPIDVSDEEFNRMIVGLREGTFN